MRRAENWTSSARRSEVKSCPRSRGAIPGLRSAFEVFYTPWAIDFGFTRKNFQENPTSISRVTGKSYSFMVVSGTGTKNAKEQRSLKQGRTFSAKKVDGNKKRARKCIRRLHDEGYGTLIVWECEMKNEKKLSNLLRQYLGETARNSGENIDAVDS